MKNAADVQWSRVMFLGFDIGNTSTTAGLYSDNSVHPTTTINYETKKNISSGDLNDLIKKLIASADSIENSIDVTGTAFSSVVPEINSLYSEVIKSKYEINAYEINSKSKFSIKINYSTPEELGIDRIVNAETVYNEYSGNTIIIDMGTATTFCVILEQGLFDGGIIAPGIGISMDALASKTSRLPHVAFEKPEKLISNDTVSALKSGLYYGWISLIEGIIEKTEAYYNKKFNVVMTGGFSKILSQDIKFENTFDPMLTMKGIKYIYDLNKSYIKQIL